MASPRTVLLHGPELERYRYPESCPFSTARAGMARAIIGSMDLLAGPARAEVAPRPAGRAQLAAFHTPAYLDAVAAAAEGHLDADGFRMGLGTPDCPVFPDMYRYAALAAGATLAGASLLLEGAARRVFNPSGGFHHAGPAHAAGFCYFNDVVLGCLALAGRGRRVLFLDLDVHHGDGVEAAFRARADVMTVSFHESGRTLFPGTGFEDDIGEGPGRGYTANVPLPAGTYDGAYLRAFRAIVPPLIEAFEPDVMVVELGMDALAGDPLAHLKLTNNAYAEALERILAYGTPLLATGGGGYHLENTARAWALMWSLLCGADAAGELTLGLGGVLLSSAEWRGGLRDRAVALDERERARVDREVAATIERVRANVFPLVGA